jgi:hypothetical protein
VKVQFIPDRFRGNMLTIVGMCMAIVLLLLGLALSVQYLFFSHQFIKHHADQLATSLAIQLNANDRIGQMNNLVANSRELVFNSRANYNRVASNYPQMISLADRLLSDSRDGADIVEKERRELVAILLRDLQTSAKTTNLSGSLGQNVALPWASSNQASILDLKVGCIKGVESNVLAPYGNNDLLNLDTKAGYIDPTTHLYYGLSIIKLPEDPDKQFRLTSLAPAVEGNVAPPRLVGPEAFEKSGELLKNGQDISASCDQLPTAVQLSIGMDVTSRVAVQSTHETTADSTAATAGANSLEP